MFPTIIATETEYGVAGKKSGRELLPVFALDTTLVPEFLKKGMPPEIFSPRLAYINTHFWMMDGSQCYLDTGGHLEWACREELGPGNATLAQIAGDRNVEEACLRANKAWEEAGQELRIFFLRNNLDKECVAYDNLRPWESHSYGCHENYLIKRKGSAIHKKIWEILGPFFIARIALIGGGWFCICQGKLLYLLSPRAAVTFCAYDKATTASRPVINMRDESHAPQKYMRLHIIVGDSLILEPARYLQLAMSEILLDAMEENFLRQCPLGEFDDNLLLNAKNLFNEDVSLRAAADLGTRRLSALDILEIYCGEALRFCETTGRRDKERDFTFELWQEMLTEARKPRPHEKLASYTDWAAKLLQAEIDADRHGYTLNDKPHKTVSGFKDKKKRARTVFERVKEIEYMFALLHPEKGLARLLERAGETKRIFSDELITQARYAPLSKCRSYARHKELRALDAYAERAGRTLTVSTDWTDLVARTTDNEVLYRSGGKHLDKYVRDPFDYQCDVSSLLEG